MAVSEEQLKEIITSLLNECKTKGSIGSDALCDRLEKYDADPSQIDEIYRSLEENKIKIIDDYEKDKELYEQIIKEISMDDPVKMYLKDIGKVPLLSADDEINLAKKMMDGDESAKRELSVANLRLVVSIAKRYVGRGMQFLDLIQEGNLGLMKAVDNFDDTLNVKFSTYAVPMIIGEIRRYLRDYNSIRVSRSLRDIAYKAIYTKENMIKKNLKEPTIDEIADEIGIEKEMIVYALDAIQSPVSLFEPVYSEGGDTLYVMDQISDQKNKEDHWLENLSLREAMNRLNQREKHIIEMRFYEGRTQMEVADEIGISQAQVSRLEKNALKTMKNYLRS